MAGSRLEKVGTIYSRTTGLIRSGAINWADRPLWYDVYEAFPPKEEPRFDRPAPNMTLKKIFYEEDKLRAMFHRNNKHLGSSNMFNNKYKSLTQKFIEAYRKLESENPEYTEEGLYKRAIEMLRRDKEVDNRSEEEVISLSEAFREATGNRSKEKPQIDLSTIFKE
ncbi:unnamed protein product [Phyllotreta striolata]|uniref:Small ribosomal subunit protein mS23 n=1 Tax=Phyllotreta striolata TaxID=444603 RepID=A0A9N9XQC2_PHYSR|nr:unnamed protein product [Phyllotreta striolata]